MINICIPLGTGSKHDNMELRYALRSIDKFVPGNNVVLVGERPEWFNGYCIPCKDVPGYKEWSIVKKILKYCEDRNQRFIYSNDDFFWLRSGHIPDYYQGTLQDAKSRLNGAYVERVKAVIDLTSSDSALFFDVHTPMWISSQFYKETWENHHRKELLCKSLYAINYAIDPQPITDLKIKRPMAVPAIYDAIRGRQFFSIGDKGINKAMIQVLNELYPDASKYE